MATETADDHSASPWRGRDVLNPWFQDLVARGIRPGKAMREIMELLQGGDLCVSVRVAGGVRALQPMHYATKEEEEQAREEYRAAVTKYDLDAAEDAIYGTSPPGGLIDSLRPGNWGHKVTLEVRDRCLLIKWLDPTFPPEYYSFVIVNPEALDRLLAPASPAHTSSAAVSPNPPVPSAEALQPALTVEPEQKPESDPAGPVVRFEDLRHGWQINRVYPFLRKHYPPVGKVPPGIAASVVWRQVDEDEAIKSENKRRGIRTPSEDVVAQAMNELRRLPD